MTQARPLAGWPEGANAPRHAPSDVHLRGFVIFVLCFIGTAISIHLLLWWLFGAIVSRQPTVEVSPLAQEIPVPPEPRLQGSIIHPALDYEDLAKMRQQNAAILNTYGWVDRPQGIVRIPVDRAMQLIVERGLPQRRDAGPTTQSSGS